MKPKNVQMPNPNPKYKPPGTAGGGRGGNRNMSTEYPCIYWEKDGKCRKFSDDTYISYCVMGPCPEQQLSNADRVRTMSDEELAEELVIEIEGLFPSLVYVPMATGNIYISRDKAEKEMLEYLQQPAEEEP